MIFTSLTFFVFFIAVFFVFWSFINNRRDWRNFLLILFSYLFYGWWDWRFLSLIVFSSAVDYSVGLAISGRKTRREKKMFLAISLVSNLGLLGIFKYFDFFSSSFSTALGEFGIAVDPMLLEWVLPIGISFYTFQTLSYTIDIYRGQLRPTRDVLAFFAFVSFFPQLVAGPIERARRLLPQFEREQIKFDRFQAVDGLRMILWGLFLKAVVADNLAHHVDVIFANPDSHSGSVLALGAVYFGFQIYGDFAGYSWIACGTARLLGFDLMVNFRTPYFSRDIGEFWRRWHISLSSWFRDYVYIPLGGNQKGALIGFRNVLIVFVVSGLWHGANWTYVFWGLFHGLAFTPIFLLKRNRHNTGPISPNSQMPILRDVVGIAMTFSVVTVGWIFFRAEDMGHAFEYLSGLTQLSIFSVPNENRSGIIWVAILGMLDWFHRNEDVPLRWENLAQPLRWGGYLALVGLVYYRGYFDGQSFIYFQF